MYKLCKVTKKMISGFLAMVMIIALAACGSDSDGKAGEEKKTSGSSKDDKLSVMIWDTYQEAGIKEILKDFTAETGIDAEVQVVTWDEYWTLLEAGAQGGSLPDVFWMHSNEAERYMSNDMLLDVTDYISDSEVIELTNYPAEIVELYMYDSKNYAVPKDVDTIALWYNKTMFDEAGLDYPDDSWTWETFVDAAAQLTKEDGSQFGYAIAPTNDQDSFYNMVYSYGGCIINEDKTASGFDMDETIQAMELVETMLQAGSAPTLETISENGPDILFKSGKVAMITQGSFMLASFAEDDYLVENADVAVLPAGPAGRVSIYNGLGWAAAANGDKTESAWKLLEYFGSEKAQIKQAELGVTMSAYKNTSDAWSKSAEVFTLQSYLDMMDEMVMRPYSKNTLAWNNMMHEKLKDAWSGNRTMREVCEDIAAEMNEVLDNE